MPRPIPTASPLILSTHLRGAEPIVEIIVLIFFQGLPKGKLISRGYKQMVTGKATDLGERGRSWARPGLELCSVNCLCVAYRGLTV